MKSLIPIIIFVIISLPVLSQILPKKEAENETAEYISEKNFPTLYNQQISFILTGDKNLAKIGNYISIDIVKPAINTNFVLSTNKKGNKIKGIFSGALNGEVSDGIVKIFSDGKLSNNISAQLNYAFIFEGLTNFYYTKDDKKYLEERKKFINRFYQLSQEKMIMQYKRVNHELDSLRKNQLSTQQTKFKELQLDSLKYSSLELSKLDSTRVDSIRALELRAKWSSIKITWVDFFANANQQKLYLLEESNAFSNQLEKRNFTGYRLGISYNFYWYSRVYPYNLGNILAQINYTYGRTNNTSSLSTSEVTNSNTYDSLNQKRVVQEKVNAYEKSKYTSNYSHTFSLNILKPINIDHKITFHFLYEYQLITTSENKEDFSNIQNQVSNIGLGLIIPFTNKADNKAKVNIEPFLKFKDIKNEFISNENFFKRSEFGLRTTVPLNYNF